MNESVGERMAVCCAECGEQTRRVYVTDEGTDICETCYHAGIAADYVLQMDKKSAEYKSHNKKAYEDCSELNAWLSVYRFGAGPHRKRAAAVINAFVGK